MLEITARHRFFCQTWRQSDVTSSCPHCHLQHSSYFSKTFIFIAKKVYTLTLENEMENEELVIICRVCQTLVEPDHFDTHQKCDTCHRWGWNKVAKRDLRSEIQPLKSRTCSHENESCRPIEAKKEKLIGCGKCSYSCSTLTQLKHHFLVHRRSSLRCPLCPDFVAHQTQSLKRHQRLVHGNNELFKCKGT